MQNHIKTIKLNILKLVPGQISNVQSSNLIPAHNVYLHCDVGRLSDPKEIILSRNILNFSHEKYMKR